MSPERLTRLAARAAAVAASLALLAAVLMGGAAAGARSPGAQRLDDLERAAQRIAVRALAAAAGAGWLVVAWIVLEQPQERV
jgi:hypothetical protein